MTDIEFKQLDIGQMLRIDKEYRDLILGKWISINIDGSIPKEQQWLDFDQNIRSYVLVKMNNLELTKRQYETGYDTTNFFIRFHGFPALTYSIRHLDKNLLVIQLRGQEMENCFKRSQIIDFINGNN